MLFGLVYGTAYFLGTVHWLYIALHTFGGMPAILAAIAILGLTTFLGLYPALAAGAAYRLCASRQRGLALWLILPAVWALMEWVRGWLFTGFPWAVSGYSQIPDAPLAGFAPLIGVYGIGWLLAITAGGLVWLLQDWQQFGVKRRQAVAIGGVLVTWVGGVALVDIAWTQPVGQPIKVNLLQGNIAQDMKWEADALVPTLRTYYRMVEAADHDADLIVLPETAFPLFLHEIPAEYIASLEAAARSKNAGLLIGLPLLDTKRNDYYNAAVLLSDPKRPSYAKSHLVPFGEYVPLKPIFGWAYTTILKMPLAGFTPGGQRQAPMQIKGQRIAPHICYEDLFGEELLDNARDANILLNLSNLAWYDPSIALAQHGQIAQTRALETGRTILRSTNSGTTAIINPRGHYLARLPERVEGNLSGMAQGYAGVTPYMRWGNTLFLLLSCLALMLGLGLTLRQQRTTHPPT